MTTTLVQEVDLRGIARSANRVITDVVIYLNPYDKKTSWLKAGECDLHHHEQLKTWRLSARLRDNATDAEHDSAYAFVLRLIGVELDCVIGQRSMLTAWIDAGGEDDFHVPSADYDPWSLKGAATCKAKWCEDRDKHIIIPDGYYVPPFNQELFDTVKGKRVEISIGPIWK